MMDQQLALEMSGGKGIGLADMLVRQLGGADAGGLPRPEAGLVQRAARRSACGRRGGSRPGPTRSHSRAISGRTPNGRHAR